VDVIAEIVDRRPRARTRLLDRAATASPEARLVALGVATALLLGAALSTYLWSRTAVRETAVELDRARSDLARATAQVERLEVERSVLRQPIKLGEGAASLGLVPPVAVVDLSAAGGGSP
jgi:hypothetical protein